MTAHLGEIMESLSDELKNQIDNMSYQDMLILHRFAPIGHYMFQGKSAEYFMKRINELKAKELNPSQISKKIGWDGKNYNFK